MSDRKTFLITGGSTGIGAATARMAVAAGYRVVLAARSEKKLAAIVDELGSPDVVLPVTCDVADLAQQEAMVSQALSAFGRIDIAFANAGVGSKAAGIEHGDPENWREMIMTNIYGCALTARVCLPEIRRNKGHILLTGSRAGRRHIKGSIYGATKWAVTGLAFNLLEELTGTGARMTLLEPGMVDTPFFDNRPTHALTAEDIAEAAMYAVSQPSHVNVSEMLIQPVPRNSG